MINHQGISSEGYRQGPYAIEENLVEAFKDFYVAAAKAALP
jgi:Rieske 2Fe-2S family protein